jgi:hypothetical protein
VTVPGCWFAAIAFLALIGMYRVWQISGPVRAWLDRALTPSDRYEPVPVQGWPPESLERLHSDVMALTEDEAEARFSAAAEAIERENAIARHVRSVPSLAERQEARAVADLSAWRRDRAQAVTRRPPTGGAA